jgi:uncharacterized protein YecT (DUF1311 family)
MTQYPAGATALTKTASALGLASLLVLAACGEPVDEKALNNRPAEPPPPAAAPGAAGAPVAAQSPLEICLNNANGTTVGINACYGEEQKQRETALAQYVAAVDKALKDEPGAAEAFDKTQTAWLALRQSYCDAIYEHWKDGTIRTTKALACQIDLTAQRTHQIWKDYLTFADSTPPVLPEPPAAE